MAETGIDEVLATLRPSELKSLHDLAREVDTAGGVNAYRMLELRDAYGAGRLGVHVRTNISKSLNGLGLGHYPDPLPGWQEEQVLVFKLGSQVADLVDALFHPSPKGAELIRQTVANTASVTLEKVRELVCS